MHDLMMIAALTGARLEAIVDLRARDCEAGLFTFKPQKKEKSARGVPIHSALVDLVARRTKGKSGADDLFPEYPVPKRSTSQRERSFRASNGCGANAGDRRKKALGSLTRITRQALHSKSQVRFCF